MNGFKTNFKAVFYTIDSFFAALIVIAALIMLYKLPTQQEVITGTSLTAQDVLKTLSELKLYELNNSVGQSWIANNSVFANNSVLDQIAVFWALNQSENASLLFNISIAGLIPSSMQLQLLAEQEALYNKTVPKRFKTVVNAKRAVTGVAKGKPITGVSSTAYLRRIVGKHNNKYLYFGGFTGQGNITAIMKDLPIINASYVTNMTLQLDVGGSFELYINNHKCGNVFTPSTELMTPDVWDITSCKQYLKQGDNSFTFIFQTSLNQSFIAGGFVKVTYVTEALLENIPYGYKTYWFPSIQGLINVYDSFYVPGNLTNITVNLSFYSEYPLFFSIGPATFEFQGLNQSQNIVLTSNNISSELNKHGLLISNLSLTTIPVRIGLGEVQINGSSADVVLSTDTSGSMGWCVSNDQEPPCPAGDAVKLDVAKNASKMFINEILKHPGSKVGLVDYAGTVKSYEYLTTNASKLISEVESYTDGGGTCICCGVNKAVDIANSGSYTLIPRHATGWRYSDVWGYEPSSDWTLPGFNDSNWSIGQAPIGNTVDDGYPTNFNTETRIIGGFYYYFRKTFNITNVSDIVSLKLGVAHDDGIIVYLNGHVVYNATSISDTTYSYWTSGTVNVSTSYLQEGENVIAARMKNYFCTTILCWFFGWYDGWVAFDLELQANKVEDTLRSKAIVIMSDGEANRQCAEQGTGSAKHDAIQAACDAYNNYGITVYTVGFGNLADEATLKAMANCGHGQYFYADNASALVNAYLNISSQIIEHSKNQIILSYGNLSTPILYNNSRIEIAYEPIINNPVGKISVTLDQDLTTCSETVSLPPAILADAKVLSYSGPHWTDLLLVNGFESYNLSRFGQNYFYLGDPFVIQAPVNYLSTGLNNLTLRVGDSPSNHTNCSSHNKLVYTVLINSTIQRGNVLSKAEGCNWTLQFEDGSFDSILIPSYYSGTKQCSYTNTSISFDSDDAYDVAAYRLFTNLDLDNDGKLFVNLKAEDLEIVITSVESVPYLWGPSILEVRVWS